MLKHFVEFFYPGSFFSETTEVEAPGPNQLPASIPEGAYAYRFFERSVVSMDGELLKGEKKNFSPRTFIGEEFGLARVYAEIGKDSILAQNMRSNRWSRVAKTRQGFVQLDAGDQVVSAFR